LHSRQSRDEEKLFDTDCRSRHIGGVFFFEQKTQELLGAFPPEPCPPWRIGSGVYPAQAQRMRGIKAKERAAGKHFFSE